MTDIFALSLVFLLPALVIFLSKKVSLFRFAGAVTVCYALGFIISFIPIGYDKGLVQTVASVAVALAIPLILFGFDLFSLQNLTKKTLAAFLLMIFSVIAVSSVSCLVWTSLGKENGSSFAGMAMGLYIGGTPNLFAVGTALLNDIDVINLANISDSILGGILFLCIVTFMRKVYCKEQGNDEQLDNEVAGSEYDFSLIEKDEIVKVLRNVVLGVLCLGSGVGLELLFNGNLDGSLFIITTVSVLGIALSFIRKVRETKGTYQVGQYLVLVFTVGLSMSLDFSVLKSLILPVFLFFACVQVGSMVLHFILCKIFRIDGKTALITCVAGIYGPPFIVPVANSCKDRSLVVPGIICGTMGLVMGNLIGIGLGSLLAAL